MKPRSVAVVGALVLFGTAVLNVPPSSASIGAKGSKSAVALTSQQIQAGALLALVDMPTGYAADTTDQAKNSQPNGTTGICNGPNAIARAQAQGAVGVGDADFAQNPQFGPFLSEGVYSFPSAKQATASMAASRTQISCGMYSASPNGVSVNYAISQIAYTKVGDDTLAFRVNVTTAEPGSAASSASVDQINVRLGNNVVSLQYGGIGGPNTTLEQQFIGKGISKLGVAIAAAQQQAKHAKGKKK